MAFRYRYSKDGDSVIPVKDYPIAAGQEANVGQGVLVKLNASGEVTPAVKADTAVLGVSEGTNFEGLGVKAKVAKIRVSKAAVYEVDHIGAGALTRGTKYGTDVSNMDTANTTTTHVTIVDVVKGKAYVTIHATQL